MGAILKIRRSDDQEQDYATIQSGLCQILVLDSKDFTILLRSGSPKLTYATGRYGGGVHIQTAKPGGGVGIFYSSVTAWHSGTDQVVDCKKVNRNRRGYCMLCRTII
jgi:hypothetical protein